MSRDFLDFFSVIGILSPSFAFAIYFSKPGKHSWLETVIFLYLLISMGFDVLNYLIASIYGVNNYPYLRMYEFSISIPLCLIYLAQYQEYKFRIIVMVLFASYLLLGLSYFTFIGSWYEANGYLFHLLCLLVTLLSLYYFIRSFKRKPYPNITSDPLFWLNSALLFYFGISIFLALYESYILSSLTYYLQVYVPIHVLVYIVSNFGLSVALWKAR